MEQFKRIVKWGGIPVGWVFQGIGIYYTARDVAAAGLPAWVWYLIGTAMLSASFVSIIIGLNRENKALRATLKTGSDIKLIEWRREYRKPQGRKVTNIPLTLNQMWKVVANVMEEKKGKKVSKEKLLNMTAGLLNVPTDDPILKSDNYSTEEKIKKVTKRIEGRMGLRRSNKKLAAEWRKRIAEDMDSHKIGLQLDGCNEYKELVKKLNEDRIPITETKLNHVIDGFIENLHALYSIQLLLSYGGTTKKLYIFPRSMRDVLKHLEEAVDRTMRGFLTRVNDTLEEYSIGKELNE